MPTFTSSPTAYGQELFTARTSAQGPIFKPGTLAETADGRKFRYAQNGATLLVAGDVLQAPAQVANHQNLTPSAAAAGATSITLTLGATAAAENLYADGWAIIDTTPGLGYAYQIVGHAAISSAGAGTIYLDPASPIQVALTTSSRVTLVSNPYKGVIQAPVTTLTGIPVGVCVFPLAASEWGWIQTGGVAPTQIDGTPAVGQAVSVPSTAAGAATINSGTLPILGHVMVTGVDGRVYPVFLTLD